MTKVKKVSGRMGKMHRGSEGRKEGSLQEGWKEGAQEEGWKEA